MRVSETRDELQNNEEINDWNRSFNPDDLLEHYNRLQLWAERV